MPSQSERRLKKIPFVASAIRARQLERLAHKELWTRAEKYPREKIPLPTVNSINHWTKHREMSEVAAKRRLAMVKEAIKKRAQNLRTNSRRK
ncbi:MAG: hypothetical protein AABW59_05335 [archaeon]